MQLINSVSNMADGFECFMDTDVTCYRASSDEVVARESGFKVTDAAYRVLDKAHLCLCGVRVDQDIDGSFIITVVEA